MSSWRRFLILNFSVLSLSLFSQQDMILSTGYEPLPDVLLSFDAVLNGKKAELTWASGNEQGGLYFTIEKSRDGIAFEKFLVIRNYGGNANLISYFDVDYKPFEGTSYYRLTQTNTAGHVLASRVVSVNRKASGSLQCHQKSDAQVNAGEEQREVLVVLRSEKGEETYVRMTVDNKDETQLTSEHNARLDQGTYVIIATSDNRLYSKTVKVSE